MLTTEQTPSHKIKLRCPKCRKQDHLHVTTIYTESKYCEVNNGRITFASLTGDMPAFIGASARCGGCGHKWRVRDETWDDPPTRIDGVKPCPDCRTPDLCAEGGCAVKDSPPEGNDLCHCPCCKAGIDAPHEYHLERRPMAQDVAGVKGQAARDVSPSDIDEGELKS